MCSLNPRPTQYVETLKKKEAEAVQAVGEAQKKEAEALQAAREASERMIEAQQAAADIRGQLEAQAGGHGGGGEGWEVEGAALRSRVLELEAEVEAVARAARERAEEDEAASGDLVRRLNDVMADHEVLSARFAEKERQLMQVVGEAEASREAAERWLSAEQRMAELVGEVNEARAAREAAEMQAAALIQHKAEWQARAAREAAEMQAAALIQHEAEWQARAAQLEGEARGCVGEAEQAGVLREELAGWQARVKMLEEASESEQQDLQSMRGYASQCEQRSREWEVRCQSVEAEMEARGQAIEALNKDVYELNQQLQVLKQYSADWQAGAEQLAEGVGEEERRREREAAAEGERAEAMMQVERLELALEECRAELEEAKTVQRYCMVKFDETTGRSEEGGAGLAGGAADGSAGEADGSMVVGEAEAMTAEFNQETMLAVKQEEIDRLKEEQAKSKEMMKEMLDKLRAREAEKEASAAAAMAKKDDALTALEQRNSELEAQVQEGGRVAGEGMVSREVEALRENEVLRAAIAQRDALLTDMQRRLGDEDAGNLLQR